MFAIAFACALAVPIVRADEKEPAIVFNNHPEAGVPKEALEQARVMGKEAKRLPKALRLSDPPKLHEVTAGSIKQVRIRYFNKGTWATEAQAREYVRGFLAHKSLDSHSFQVWSQVVDVPEMECLIDFTDEYQKKILDDDLPFEEGRLLIWNTESCFRDATGRWWFVNAFDYFHAAHPKGNRENVKPR